MVAEFPAEIAAQILPPVMNKAKGTGAGESPLPADLSAGERAVVQLLSGDAATHIDALAERSGLSISELSSALLGLEMREMIRQLPGKCFVRKL